MAELGNSCLKHSSNIALNSSNKADSRVPVYSIVVPKFGLNLVQILRHLLGGGGGGMPNVDKLLTGGGRGTDIPPNRMT